MCHICNKKCKRNIKSNICIWPKILILILDYGKEYSNAKKEVKVIFDEILYISDFSSQKDINQIYNLYGVVIQLGQNGEKTVASCKTSIKFIFLR